MTDNASLEKYIAYLEKLKKRLDVYFKEQKEFLKCKAGCDLCCKASYYPVSQLEYEYIKIGLNEKFTFEEREKINQAVLAIFKKRRLFAKENSNLFDFFYECPLLVDGVCGIYEYRGLLCRSHGLIYNDTDNLNKENIPHCVTLGLNYSDVFEKETNKFSEEKAVALGIKARPKAYDLSYTPLMKAADGLEFGDIRMLFEWILLDIENFEELIKE
ncbi:MAG: hypothetical protein WCF95_06315 [bacterium]